MTSRGDVVRYAHLDIVKCATERPWSQLSANDQSMLSQNCLPFLEEQLKGRKNVKLILLNGRTALNHAYSFLTHGFDFQPDHRILNLGDTTSELLTGRLHIAGRRVTVVGWSANIVNSHLTTSAVESLACQIRTNCPVFG